MDPTLAELAREKYTLELEKGYTSSEYLEGRRTPGTIIYIISPQKSNFQDLNFK